MTMQATEDRKTPADARARALQACQDHAAAAAQVKQECRTEPADYLEARLAAEANRFWPHYEFSSGMHEKIREALRRERPVTALAWAGKVLLAVLIAYPGHVAMGEILGYPAFYGMGFKAYLTTWPIVAVLLLAAELLIIRAAVEFRLAGDAHDYLHRGYNPGHYDRGYMYRRPEEATARRRLGWIFYGCAGVLALADLAFNVAYMWDMTGQAALAALAGGFFTALLVGLSILLAHVYEYHHLQLAETRRAAEHIQPGRGYVPIDGTVGHAGPEAAPLPAVVPAAQDPPPEAAVVAAAPEPPPEAAAAPAPE
ncbi:MAG: hypothetical protein FJZ01_25125, partial [Candidatus Sericytochromatia bacterium]|nr:hypothetical protein [Candidatus Tanganyikabacteria bacterium]